MPEQPSPPNASPAPVEIDLRNRGLAALLAWLWPGAGHLYQRRYPKAILYMVCILGLFISGLWMGGGHVVYYSWTKEDKRLYYICQIGVGIPAMPALLQNRLVMNGKEPILGGLMAPPEQPVRLQDNDQLAQWHAEYPSNFEMGTIYTFIAGLLNILVIFDAFAGPAYAVPSEKAKKKPEEKPAEKTADKPATA